MSKFCPIHGTEDSKHLVNYCTCPSDLKFPINLIGDLVAIEPNAPENRVALPDWKRTLNGKVLAVGPEVRNIVCNDKAYFGAAVGMDAVFDGREVRIMKEKDIDFVYEV